MSLTASTRAEFRLRKSGRGYVAQPMPGARESLEDFLAADSSRTVRIERGDCDCSLELSRKSDAFIRVELEARISVQELAHLVVHYSSRTDLHQLDPLRVSGSVSDAIADSRSALAQVAAEHMAVELNESFRLGCLGSVSLSADGSCLISSHAKLARQPLTEEGLFKLADQLTDRAASSLRGVIEARLVLLAHPELDEAAAA